MIAQLNLFLLRFLFVNIQVQKYIAGQFARLAVTIDDDDDLDDPENDYDNDDDDDLDDPDNDDDDDSSRAGRN